MVSSNTKEKRMQKIMRFAIMTALLAVTMFSANAQSTDVVQRVNFVLRGRVQTSSGVKAVRVTTKDILAALNASGAYQFGPRATLLFVSSDDQPPALVVHDGSGQTATNTDVGDYFGITEIGEAVRSSDETTRWETWQISFDNGNTNVSTAFQLWGATTIHRGPIHTAGIGTLAGSQRVQLEVR